ncbi:hypothetical protein [Aeromicrobium sp.]|uniref:hypothetical protein n=1 Tax=Aeromicrobium sp. TaxID=1871063 RepID=UPI0019C99BEC|nr:hypothetical protein [Aeromicrobium sp.]MBC7633946.1 hypothetical protein [Aeromicrobium sp.]
MDRSHDDNGTDRKFLIDLAGGSVKMFPKGSSFSAVSPDSTQVLLSTLGTASRPGSQAVVQMPTA